MFVCQSEKFADEVRCEALPSSREETLKTKFDGSLGKQFCTVLIYGEFLFLGIYFNLE